MQFLSAVQGSLNFGIATFSKADVGKTTVMNFIEETFLSWLIFYIYIYIYYILRKKIYEVNQYVI